MEVSLFHILGISPQVHGQRKGMAISMKEKKDESVEELAEALESRLARKEEPDELEEIKLEDVQEGWFSGEEDSEGFWEEDFAEEETHGNRFEKAESEKATHKNRFEEKDSVKESRESRRKKEIPEDDFPEGDWEEEEIAPMKPWVMAAATVGIVALAAIICAVLWHFTHLEKSDGDNDSQMSASVSAENLEMSPGESGELSENMPSSAAPDSEVTASPESEASTSISAASSASDTSSAAPSTTAPSSPQTTVQPGAQASAAEQEPISGTTAMEFIPSSEDVTPKDVINLRSEPSTLNADNIVAQAKNGEILTRTGVNEATGWTRVEYNGETLYAVTQYLTTDLTYKTPVQAANPNRVNTKDGRIILFTDCSDNITPKEYVNLRTEPSTSEGEATVRCQISNGEVVHRTGYSPDAGWSRVEYNGEILYVVSSYMYTVE